MDKVYQDISPDGLKTSAHVEADGTIHFAYEQDAAPAFEAVLQDRNAGGNWQKGVKSGFVKALHVPNGVVMELFGLGINIYTAPAKDIVAGLHKLNRYQACDLTGKRIA
jgi:hypothetical protein